jgi:hypothetical protein
VGEIKPTGEGLANRVSGRPDYADLPPVALTYMARGYSYWEAEDLATVKVELCHVLDRVFEAVDFSGDFDGFATLVGQAMAGLSLYSIERRSARWHGKSTYDGIPIDAIEAWAATYTEGAIKYGAYNWRKGLKIRNLISHAIGHVYLLADDDCHEDHFGHFLWNCGTAIWMAKNRPELDDRFGSPLAPKGAAQPARQPAQSQIAATKPLAGDTENACSVSGSEPTPIDTFLILSESIEEARTWAKANGFCACEKIYLAGKQWVWCNCREVADHYEGSKVVILPSGDAPTKTMTYIKSYLLSKIKSGELCLPTGFPSHQCRAGFVLVCSGSMEAALQWANQHSIPHALLMWASDPSKVQGLGEGAYVVDLLETATNEPLPASIWFARSEALRRVAFREFIMWKDLV